MAELDIDRKLVDEAEEAFRALQTTYYEASDADKWDLEPQIEAALQKWAIARIRLLKADTVATEEDLARIREIKENISRAVDTQEKLVAAARLVGFLAKFIL